MFQEAKIEVDKFENKINNVISKKWFRFKCGTLLPIGYKTKLSYRSFKANKIFSKYLLQLTS